MLVYDKCDSYKYIHYINNSDEGVSVFVVLVWVHQRSTAVPTAGVLG